MDDQAETPIKSIQELQKERAKTDLAVLEELTQSSERFRKQRERASEFSLPTHGNHPAGLIPVIVIGNWGDTYEERAVFGADCPKAEECKDPNGPTVQFRFVYEAGWKEQK